MPLLESFLNNPIAVSIGAIIISSLVGFYINSRVRDRCLRDLDGYLVTVEDKAGKVMWGKLEVFSAGMELLYSAAKKDTQGHVENSYILYNAELANLQAIYRIHDDQSKRRQRKRAKDIKRTYQPSIFQRALRGLRNFFSTFKDAIVQSLNTLLGQRAAQSPQNTVLSKHKELTTSGAQLLSGAVGNAYEPILERHIGQYIVLEMVRGEQVEEEYGILKEYSDKYIEILNVRVEVPLYVYVKDPKGSPEKQIEVIKSAQGLRVSNPLDRTLLVEGVQCGENKRQVDVSVPAHESANVSLQGDEVDQEVKLIYAVRCLSDLVVPRSLAVVRHAGKREKLSLDVLLGLDELSDMPWMKRLIDSTKRETPTLSTDVRPQ